MNETEQRKEVFAWFGAASYYAQCVEVELWIARIVLVRENDFRPSEDEWKRVEGQPLTMGQLLRLIERDIGLKGDESTILDACAKKRNWLAHSYWEDRSHLLETSRGCAQAVDELSDLCDFFKAADGTAQAVSSRIRARVGLSEEWGQEWAQKTQEEYLRRLKSGESRDEIFRDQEERLRRLAAHAAGSNDAQSEDQ